MTGPAAAPGEIFIFPLKAVLFPGGTLPLKVFEQRYLEMTKICLREERPFGVCLIKEGEEVGTPAVPEAVGCLARIKHWDMPQLGVFHLIAEGLQRFRILSSRVLGNGLITAAIETLPEPDGAAPADAICAEVLKAIIEKLGVEHFPTPHRFDDATWVGYRLSEVLPIGLDLKQRLLQVTDAEARLAQLNRILAEQGARS